jgi:hypothetical protein
LTDQPAIEWIVGASDERVRKRRAAGDEEQR